MHADLLTDGHDGVKLLVYGLDRDRNLINRHDQPVLANFVANAKLCTREANPRQGALLLPIIASSKRYYLVLLGRS